MNKVILSDVPIDLPDNKACLEWLKNQRYPEGIHCPVCKRITKHSKSSKDPCYICHNCGNHIFPTAGTIFYKSSTPLKTWFTVIRRVLEAKGRISAKEVQREYGVTYKTAWRMLHLIRESLKETKTEKDASLRPGKLQIANPEDVNKIPVNPPEPVSKGLKRDRTAGLLKLQMLLYQHPKG
jgi:transposase-like protein